MGDRFFPYGRQTIDQADIDAVAAVLRSDYLTTGPQVASFEVAFAAACGARFAVACANGTAALHIAALALDVGPEDVVLAPSMSFLASANGMRYVGAQIVFMDCDPDTGLVTPETFAAAIARAPRRPRVAVVVHLNGNTCDMEAIAKIAEQHGIVLVEDACHAVGSRFERRDGSVTQVGDCAYSALACFSLHPVKTITMGEGGVVTTNDPALQARLQLFRSHGMVRTGADLVNRDLAFDDQGDQNPWYYEMPVLGYNYRATDFQCALGESQLRKLPWLAQRRRELQALYDRLFVGSSRFVRPVATPKRVMPVLHLYAILAPFGRDGLPTRGRAMRRLRERGVGTMVHYLPIHRQPYYAKLDPDLHLPGADAYYEQVLSIPFYPTLTDDDAEYVGSAIMTVLGEGG